MGFEKVALKKKRCILKRCGLIMHYPKNIVCLADVAIGNAKPDWWSMPCFLATQHWYWGTKEMESFFAFQLTEQYNNHDWSYLHSAGWNCIS